MAVYRLNDFSSSMDVKQEEKVYVEAEEEEAAATNNPSRLNLWRQKKFFFKQELSTRQTLRHKILFMFQ